MRDDSIWSRIALGAAAGAAGTILLQLFRQASQRMLPADAIPPIKEHPGEFMIRKAERLLPRSARKIPKQRAGAWLRHDLRRSLRYVAA